MFILHVCLHFIIYINMYISHSARGEERDNKHMPPHPSMGAGTMAQYHATLCN